MLLLKVKPVDLLEVGSFRVRFIVNNIVKAKLSIAPIFPTPVLL